MAGVSALRLRALSAGRHWNLFYVGGSLVTLTISGAIDVIIIDRWVLSVVVVFRLVRVWYMNIVLLLTVYSPALRLQGLLVSHRVGWFGAFTTAYAPPARQSLSSTPMTTLIS